MSTELCQIRLDRLTARLLSPAVQVPEPRSVGQVPARLSPGEVEQVFTEHVPGVRDFLFRGLSGQYSLRFLKTAYSDGLRAFEGTPIHDHLTSLMRLIVHHGQERGAEVAPQLAELAESFQDCQAVQGRAIERIGLQLLGLERDFEGLVVSLVGSYKSLALKTLAVEHVQTGVVHDDDNPTHYENRLLADVGQLIGCDAADIRRAALDEHAAARFQELSRAAADEAAVRCRELFDARALLAALVAEVNGFSEETPPGSLPALFLRWAAEGLTEKHLVFDEETCMRVDIDCGFALSLLEALFLGTPQDPPGSCFRGSPLRSLFAAAPSLELSPEVALEREPADHSSADVAPVRSGANDIKATALTRSRAPRARAPPLAKRQDSLVVQRHTHLGVSPWRLVASSSSGACLFEQDATLADFALVGVSLRQQLPPSM